MDFRNKVVLVTGASSGIGAAIAVAFNVRGAKVIMVGRNGSKINKVALSCADPLVIIADIAIDEDVQRIVDQTIKKFGKLDILINNAGILHNASIFDSNMMESYDAIMKVNVRGLIHLTSLAAPYLVKTKGNVVNICSVSALITPIAPGWTNYSVSKAAVCHFNACAATELAPHGVRVNAISPGPVKTDILQNTDKIANWEDFTSFNSLGRVSEPEEIADLVLFLASDKAKGITGSNFVSDNGVMIKRG